MGLGEEGLGEEDHERAADSGITCGKQGEQGPSGAQYQCKNMSKAWGWGRRGWGEKDHERAADSGTTCGRQGEQGPTGAQYQCKNRSKGWGWGGGRKITNERLIAELRAENKENRVQLARSINVRTGLRGGVGGGGGEEDHERAADSGITCRKQGERESFTGSW